MTLLIPAGIRQFSGDPKHPFFRAELAGLPLVATVNGEPVDKPWIAADEINGYVKCFRLDKDGQLMYEPFAGDERPITFRLKGKVQLFVRKATV